MKERPIIFSGEMVRAILAGRKTQTRRVVKPQPEWTAEFGGCWVWKRAASSKGLFWKLDRPSLICDYAPWQVGDRLWVKEKHARLSDQQLTRPHYFADGPMPTVSDRHDAGLLRTYSPIHMPRWASRITLEVTSVRVERVQDISEEDAKAEGVSETCVLPGDRGSFIPSFGMLWEQINGKRGYGWDANPWVWVLEFRRVA